MINHAHFFIITIITLLICNTIFNCHMLYTSLKRAVGFIYFYKIFQSFFKSAYYFFGGGGSLKIESPKNDKKTLQDLSCNKLDMSMVK